MPGWRLLWQLRLLLQRELLLEQTHNPLATQASLSRALEPFRTEGSAISCVTRLRDCDNVRRQKWLRKACVYRLSISKLMSISSLTLTAPPAILIGVMPKSVCLRVTEPL